MDYTQQEHPPEQGAVVSTNSAASHRMRDHLKAYQDGELPPLRRWWVGRHVGKCAACQAEITVLQRLARDMQELERATPRPQLRARILASLPDAPPVQSIQRSPVQPTATRPVYPVNAHSGFGTTRRPMLALGGACAALLLLMVGAFALNHLNYLNYWQRTIEGAGNGSLETAIAPSSGDMSTPENFLARNGGGTSGASPLAQPAHAPSDPFLPADASVAASEAPVSVSSLESGKTITKGTHSSSQTASPTSATTVNGEEYTDPTSRAAEQLAARVLPEKLEAEHHLAAAPQLQAVHFVPEVSGRAKAEVESVQVVLAVADISAARRQVQKWAEETGAKVMTVTAHPAESVARVEVPSGVPNTSGVGTGPSTIPSASPATLLKIQVPARQTDVFKSRLNQMGTPLISGGKPVEPLPHIAKIQEASDDAIATPAPHTSKAGQNAPKATVTILLRLQAGSQ